MSSTPRVMLTTVSEVNGDALTGVSSSRSEIIFIDSFSSISKNVHFKITNLRYNLFTKTATLYVKK
jgi:hypothetical protein